MPLDTGRKLGPYEILAPLVADGMGEVYKHGKRYGTFSALAVPLRARHAHALFGARELEP